MKKGYIYKITNLIDNKIYIGKSTRCSKWYLEHYYGSGIIIKQAIQKYGKQNFKKEILEFINFEDETELDLKECYYIGLYHSTDYNIGYNRSIGGEGAAGKILSEETKLRISQSNKNKPKSAQHILNMRISQFSRNYTVFEEDGTEYYYFGLIDDLCKNYGITNKDELRFYSKRDIFYKSIKIKEFFDKTLYLQTLSKTAKIYLDPFKHDYISYWTFNQRKNRYEKELYKNINIYDCLDKSKITKDIEKAPYKWWNNGISETFAETPPNDSYKQGRVNKKSIEYIEYQKHKLKNNRIKGKSHWYNNGEIEIITDTCPDGFVLGALHKTTPTKGKHHYTNGTKNILADSCPDGYWPGTTYKNKN